MNQIKVIGGGRQSGRTTKLLEAVIDWLWDHPEGTVHFFGAYPKWVREVVRDCQAAGLVADIRFWNPDRIRIGLQGTLEDLVVVDDFDKLPPDQQTHLMDEVVTRDHELYYTIEDPSAPS